LRPHFRREDAIGSRSEEQAGQALRGNQNSNGPTANRLIEQALRAAYTVVTSFVIAGRRKGCERVDLHTDSLCELP